MWAYRFDVITKNRNSANSEIVRAGYVDAHLHSPSAACEVMLGIAKATIDPTVTELINVHLVEPIVLINDDAHAARYFGGN